MNEKQYAIDTLKEQIEVLKAIDTKNASIEEQVRIAEAIAYFAGRIAILTNNGL